MVNRVISRKTMAISFASIAALLLAACSQPEPPPAPVRSVKLMQVGEVKQQISIQYAGVVTARSETDLGFRVAGKVLSRPVISGQAVHKGQLLAQLDATDYQLSAAAAQAQLRAAITERDLQAADLTRYRELREQNFISAAEIDRRTAALRAADSRVEEAKAQVHAQDNQAQYTSLVANADGVVTATFAEAGQVVSAGTPVIRLALDGSRDVSFAVPEQRLAQVTPGQEVLVRAWSNQAHPQPARVREIAASADPATRTFAVKVEILGTLQPPLGTTVTVDWPQPAQAPVSIQLPSSAIWRDPSGANAVWVFDPANSTVTHRRIEVGHAIQNDWSIASGLQAGEQVVIAGVHVLQEGEKVTVFKDLADKADLAPAADASAGDSL